METEKRNCFWSLEDFHTRASPCLKSQRPFESRPLLGSVSLDALCLRAVTVAAWKLRVLIPEAHADVIWYHHEMLLRAEFMNAGLSEQSSEPPA